MGEIVEATRNIFIDTEQYHTSKDLVNVLLPNSEFSVSKDQSIRITLEQFEAQKKWYNVNTNNNKFYIYDSSGTGSYTQVEIAQGDYFNFGADQTSVDSFCAGIYQALVDVSSGYAPDSVTYNVNTRKLSIDMSGVTLWSGTKTFRTFQIPPSRQGALPANVTATGYYSDNYELLGAKPNKYTTDAVEAFSKNGNVFTSFYPASLYTVESVHLAVDLQTQNYQTPSLDVDSTASRCIPTQVFARIPLDMGNLGLSSTVDQPSLIRFTDTGAKVFTLNLQSKHLETMRFKLLDGKGREIQEVSEGQYANGALSYKMVLRWEAIQDLEKGMAMLMKKDNTIPDFYQKNQFLGKM